MDETIALQVEIEELSHEISALKEIRKQLVEVCLTRKEITQLLKNLRPNKESVTVSMKLSRILQHPFYKSVPEGESVH